MSKQKKDYTNLIAGIVIMALATFFYVITIGTKSFMFGGKGTIAPDAIPKAVAIGMFVLGIAIIVKWAVELKKAPAAVKAPVAEEDEPDLSEAEHQKRVLFQKITMPITIVLIFLYILVMPSIGFTLSTIAFLTLQITLLSTDLSPKSWLKSFIIAVIAGVVIFLVFGKAFGLAIPLNDFGF